MNTPSSDQRPDVLETISTSQMEEMEVHFNSGDRQAWNRLVQSYGWTSQQAESVWTWFGERPSPGQTT